jgi:protein transport protein SEC61 subunit alpha
MIEYLLISSCSIIYGYFEIAAKEGDLAGMKGMIMG